MERPFITVDGNEAAALVAHRLNEVIAIYPITPASPMGELADAWSAAGRKNIFGTVPQVIEMQSEGGAAGAVHGSLQCGALTTTFTASQGLLLMIPNMYKIAGELTPAVIHIAARSVATHALSIFGDHSDVMAARATGWGMLFAASVQEAHDFALISQVASLESRIPFMHIMDGFRTSHEINRMTPLTDDDLRLMMDSTRIREHHQRSLNPDRPVLRGSAQNPDVFFQAREAANPFYDVAPAIVQRTMDRFAERTGRHYHLFDYSGADDAEQVIVLMGSGCGAVEEVVHGLTRRGEKVGLLKVRLYRPLDAAALVAALPETVRRIAVLDRTKEPGAVGEPLYQDVATVLHEEWERRHGSPIPQVYGGRYGLSSKEFTPAMVVGIFRHLTESEPKRHFTVGIVDDVTRLSLAWDDDDWQEADDVTRAVFYGLGSDGTVGANKNSVKIVGENTPLAAQGYFVYDSRKAGSQTVSHLRFARRPIQATYLIRQAHLVGCHQFQFVTTRDVLSIAAPGATFLLNSPYGPEEVWDHLPGEVQEQIIEKKLRFYVIDAFEVAREAGLGGRINTVMQTCFFGLVDLISRDEAVEQIKQAIHKTYAKRGEVVVQRNCAAVDTALENLHEVHVPAEATATRRLVEMVDGQAPDFVQRVTRMMLEGKGDLLPVSALPVDGTFPTATSQFEKRSIAQAIPIWDPDICIQCGLCALSCPHAAIRSKAYPADSVNGKPDSFQSRQWTGKDLPDWLMTIQVAPDDCTGCGVCVDVCPARRKDAAKFKAINMRPKQEHLAEERANFEYFRQLPEMDRTRISHDQVKGSQLLQPLFEYSGACAGCGETPYLKLLSQLFGERAVIANATGCSSIYGGNLPTTPWSCTAEGRGPAWANSLFEDNAEFGLGMRLALDQQESFARQLLAAMASAVGQDLAEGILTASPQTEQEIAAQRERVQVLRQKLAGQTTEAARTLLTLADVFVPRSVWIVGGDGWAYDIGFGGVDHVLASGRNVNILVLDTEVYSNTGGQASKATPRAAIAKFAAGGKTVRRKDLGMIAVDYGSVYVAQVAIGAQPLQTIKAFHEAESYPGTSLIIAYSPCIAHGIDMSTSMSHQKDAVGSAFWPLYRYDPCQAHDNGHPFHLDSRKPKITFRDFAMKEARFAALTRSDPDGARRLFDLAQKDIDDQWHFYEQMAGIERELSEPVNQHSTREEDST
ncbi:Pyruvate-flavodoxin oxidoreductase [Maioricimonas rarisocia]|uniref:Pyruvate-flavodoxin oxidoreductase n=1 Tax=Maioricimonas rarisocia TaxID=2528026 RepID=A0A517ZEY0_9PLAN|nr:pyruvate:ferredoxin (flavodoxin) oxidoreductase [Maioricimonas rarisocia]QDU41045.1 Pyruvate-flavodoxin oxidoreductase [Maioricimonas rarisocia]